MKINIAQRLRPFSHIPGERFVLPSSFLGFEIYPTLFRVYDLSSSQPSLISENRMSLSGPAKNFTIQQDLEKGMINVWGHYKEGYVRYKLLPDGEKSFVQKFERYPEGYERGEKKSCFVDYQTIPRLSLGGHKAQDWEMMRRSESLVDILPIWHRLGQMVPKTHQSNCEGTLELLKRCRDLIQSDEKLKLYQSFLDLFHAGFEGGLFPRLIDSQHQGYGDFPLPNQSHVSPLTLLSEGAKEIQRLFVSVDSDQIAILKHLPPEFHCGRMIDIDCGTLGNLSIEWTKKSIRQMIFKSRVDQEISFDFQSGLKRYRLRTNDKDRGLTVSTNAPVEAKMGETYLFDNFQN